MTSKRDLLLPEARHITAELLRRVRARQSFTAYCQAVDIPGRPVSDAEAESEDKALVDAQFTPVETRMAAHHLVFTRAIDRCLATPYGRLILQAPPGSAKSTYTSVLLPPYLMARKAHERVIIASYASKLAWKQSRRARQVCRSEKHLSIWADRPELSSDQRAVDQWALTNGSELLAAGFQAGITGSRAGVFIVDDPVSNREDADSEKVRERIREEYMSTINTRLLPNAQVILMATRWHMDDLIGWILPEDYDGRSGRILCRDGKYWEVVNIPAKCEREDDLLGRQIGDYLWPEWFPREHWTSVERDPRASRVWASLYQQRPTLGEGLEFKRDWFKWYDPDDPDARPAVLSHYGATDWATKEDKGDFTEHGVVGVDDQEPNFHLWFLDWWYKQATTDIGRDQWLNLLHRWHPRAWVNEGGPIDRAVGPMLREAMENARPAVWTEMIALPSIKNKAIKLNTLQAMVASGRVHMPLNREWATRLVDQLCNFPAVLHDDAADTAGLLARMLDGMVRPFQPGVPAPRKQLVPFTAAWLEYVDEDDKQKVRYF